MNPGHGWLRLLRGGLLATCCVLLAVSGHRLGGGPAHPTGAILVAAGAIGAGSVAWAHRQRGFGQLLAAAACAQLAFHAALSLPPSGGASEGHMQAAATSMEARMLAAHAAATVAMAWVLARGDAVIWRLSRSLWHLVVLPLRRTRPPVPERPRAAGALVPTTAVRTGLLLAAAEPRRGPPRRATA